MTVRISAVSAGLSALAGKREYMELGGLRNDGDRVFLLSTTHGPEAASLAAFRAVVKTYERDESGMPAATRSTEATSRGNRRDDTRFGFRR